MRFDISTQATSRILKTPVQRIEGVANGDIDVRVSPPTRRITIYDDLAPRHLKVDTDIVEMVFAAVPVRCANDDPAGQNTRMEFNEPRGSFQYSRAHRLRGWDIAEGDLRGDRVHQFTRVA